VTEFNSADRPGAVLAELVSALNDFRDALVSVSLALQDYQFDFDGHQRQAAEEVAQEWVLKAKDFSK